jgi:hypothetical protein
MSKEPAESEMQDGEEVDAGEPIGALATFEHDAPRGFLRRVRRAIQRRTAVAHLASFAAGAPAAVLREAWIILNEQLNPRGPRKDGGHGNKAS